MSQILSKTVIKLMTASLASCNYAILCFGGQSPNFGQISIFKGIKLDFGGGVNSEMLIYVNFAIQNEFDKNKGILSHFLTKFVRPLFY